VGGGHIKRGHSLLSGKEGKRRVTRRSFRPKNLYRGEKTRKPLSPTAKRGEKQTMLLLPYPAQEGVSGLGRSSVRGKRRGEGVGGA